MRWVDRGPSPPEVAYYARTYTRLWVQHFHQGIGARPDQHNYWTVFAVDLRERFHQKCGYCERRFEPVGELQSSVDHFRPRSRFPRLVYDWDNWVSSCQRCNFAKADQWPDTGYVDPCAVDLLERPEERFDYVPLTGEIVPKSGLTHSARHKAQSTIDDIGLNETRLRETRFRLIGSFVQDLLLATPGADRFAVVSRYQEPSEPHVGVVKMFTNQLRQAGRI